MSKIITPEKALEYSRRYWKKIKADPDRLAARRAAMRDDTKVRRAASKEDPRIWARKHLGFIRYRAKKKGLPFDLTVADIETPVRCVITGWELQYDNRRLGRDSPSIDRKIPLLGYVRGNIRTISTYANTLRGNCLQPHVFEALAADAAQIRAEFSIDG